MKLLLATDAWEPQINGVATTYHSIVPYLNDFDIKIIHPEMFKTVPTTYPGIRLSVISQRHVKNIMSSYDPDYIHIGVEGPIGIQMKRFCDRNRLRYTTAFHTKYAEYAKKHLMIPEFIGWKFLKWFHKNSSSVMVPTQSLLQELTERGFCNLKLFNRGVNTSVFYPRNKKNKETILTYVGRVSKEKNIESFLQSNVPGKKCVVGDGPELKFLKKKYPEAMFLGMLKGQELAEAYSNSDIFVFPSKTDTFGIVILEALASGLPVAAYPVTGPMDILTEPGIGFMNENIEISIQQALLHGDKEACINFAKQRSWENAAMEFKKNLIPIR